MKALVTGSTGHLGEALMRTLRSNGADCVGLDIKPSDYTDIVGTVADRSTVRRAMKGIDTVFHAATLHKPHLATHTRQQFVDTNISGTLNLLEEATAAGVRSFVFTSTTSLFGDSMRPGPGEPAVWVTEDLPPRPKNIYGTTKLAAEFLCRLFHRNEGLACLVLRTSRFFPEDDDNAEARASFKGENLKTNEMLHRRADLADIVDAHLLAADRASSIGFGLYIISATTPFLETDTHDLREDAAAVIEKRVPGAAAAYRKAGWQLPTRIGRVYVNERARNELGWSPNYDFRTAIERVASGRTPGSPLARAVGSKGYHDRTFADGPYPIE